MSRSSLPFSKPRLGFAERRACSRVLKSGWLTTGPENRLFEEEFSQVLEANFSLSVNSATSGLHLIFDALEIGADDWVITTPYTFTASAEILRYLGAHPLFVDIDEKTGNIDPAKIREALESNDKKDDPKRIKAILPVHLAGLPCDMTSLMEVAREYNLAVVEDCAHAFPVQCTVNERKVWVGTVAEGGVFSFYANKTITTGEGGMVVTNLKHLKDHMSLMRLHGIDRDVWNRYSQGAGHLSWQYDVTAAGYKYNLTNFQAAIGRVQLKRAFKFKKIRTDQALIYNQAFDDLDVLETPPVGEDHAWHIYMLRLNLNKLTIDRNDFIKELYEKGIHCSVHFRPLHTLTYYKKSYQFEDSDFPRAYSLYSRTISLPLYVGLKKSQQKRVVKAVKEIAHQFRRTGDE